MKWTGYTEKMLKENSTARGLMATGKADGHSERERLLVMNACWAEVSELHCSDSKMIEVGVVGCGALDQWCEKPRAGQSVWCSRQPRCRVSLTLQPTEHWLSLTLTGYRLLCVSLSPSLLRGPGVKSHRVMGVQWGVFLVTIDSVMERYENTSCLWLYKVPSMSAICGEAKKGQRKKGRKR